MESKKKKKTVMKNVGAGREYRCRPIENGLQDMGRGKGKLGHCDRVAWTYIYYQV